MNILQVTPAFYPSMFYGGGPTVAYEISQNMTKLGHNVVVYTTNAFDKTMVMKNDYIKLNNVDVYYFKNISNYLSYKYKLFLPIEMMNKLKNDINNFDIIHIHDTRTFPTIMTNYFSNKFKIPQIIQLHGTLTSITKDKFKMKYLFDKIFLKSIIDNSRKIIVLNDSVKDKCISKGISETKISVIPNGVNLSKYRNPLLKGKFKEKYNIDDNKNIILYLGRIHESKKINLLIKSIKLLQKEDKNILLIIAGPDDGYLNDIKNMINKYELTNNVLITGIISENEKISAFIDSDVFVTPCFYGFPLTFLEAMACGLPIVTTIAGDYINGNNNIMGYVTEDNYVSIKKGISDILYDDDIKFFFKKNALKNIENYDWKNITKNLISLYNNL